MTRTANLTPLGKLLVQTAQVYDQLEDALHGTQGVSTGDRVTGGGDSRPLPIQADVAEHRHLLLRGLRYWASKVHATPRVLAQGGVSHLVAWLVSEAHTLPAADQSEMGDNLRDWMAGVETATAAPSIRARIPLGGTCPTSNEHWTCGGTLAALLPVAPTDPAYLQCSECKSRFDVTDLPSAADVELSLSDAAALTGTPAGTLKTRVHYGRLIPTTRTPLRVRLGDVLRSECVTASD